MKKSYIVLLYLALFIVTVIYINYELLYYILDVNITVSDYKLIKITKIIEHSLDVYDPMYSAKLIQILHSEAFQTQLRTKVEMSTYAEFPKLCKAEIATIMQQEIMVNNNLNLPSERQEIRAHESIVMFIAGTIMGYILFRHGSNIFDLIREVGA